jgi:hypothetical protein
MGTVTELSIRGVKLDLAAPLQPGRHVRVSFRIPGRGDPLDMRGCIQWRKGLTLGLELEDIPEESAQKLREIVEPE